MTRLRVITPAIETAPGEIAIGSIEIVNESNTAATYTVRVVGTGTETTSTPLDVHVEAGQTVICEIPMQIAPTLGVGQHAAAFEVASSHPGDAALLSPFTVSIASVERVLLTAIPSTIRARRRATFHLDVANNEANPVSIELTGSAPDVTVQFSPDRFDLAPGQRAVSTAKVRGPRHWSGEPTQHNLLVSAAGRAATTSITAPYIQRPLFAQRLRMILAAVTVVALWLAAIGGVWLWWSDRADTTTDAATTIVAVDTDGDGIPDAFFDVDGNPVAASDTDGDGIPDTFVDANGDPITDTDTNGDGIPDTFVDANGDPIRGVDTDGDGVVDTFVDANGNPIGAPTDGTDTAAARPTSTTVRGTVKASGDIDDVLVTMAPIALGGAPDPTSTPLGFARPDEAPAKIWSARYGRVDTGLSQQRITQAVPPLTTTPQADGVWLFGDVPLGQTYEIAFFKPGHDTQSFVFTPPDDGSPIDLDVELKSARGSLSGRVLGPNGPLGGAEVTVTDGILTFTTTSATDGDQGSWSLDGLSTPAVYTVTSTLRGYGTQVLQVELGAGETRTGANLVMQPGVATISGRILDDLGTPLGGVTVTATSGETSLTTTSLTEGNIGFYSIPQLELPGPYTLSVELDGYVGQTLRLALAGSVSGVDFDLIPNSLTLTGRVTSADGTGIESAGVTLSTGDLEFRVPTASAPDRGAFRVEDLPPGLYTVTFRHFEHLPVTEFITLEAGVQPPPLNVTLQPSDGPPEVGTGSLRVEVIDQNATSGSTVPREVKDSTVTVINYTTKDVVAQETLESNNFRFDDLPIGTYTVRATAPFYNDSPDFLVTVGLSERFLEIPLIRLGAASGKIVDPTDPTKKFVNVAVSLYLEPRAPGDSPFDVTRTDLNSVWQTDPDALLTGTYSVEVDENAAALRGWVVRNDQILDSNVTGADPEMKFVIPPDVTDPIEVGDIEADPYPNISGVVYRPILNRAVSPPRTELVPIDNAGLQVTMECPGGVPTPAEITDEQTTISGTLNDTFRIPKETVDLNRLIGDCTLTYEATGFAPLTLNLNGVEAGTTDVPADRQLNAALTAPAPNIRGTVFWVDAGAAPADRQIFLDGVTVATNRTTGFGPGAGTALPPLLAGADDTVSETTVEGSGRWSLPGQVFGVADYSFSAANFDPAVVTITIDENGLQLPPSTDSNASVSGDLTTGFAVELKRPADGTIRGSIAIESSRTQTDADFENIVISAVSPSGTPISEAATAPAPGETATTLYRPTPSTFEIINAGAGTWTINFSEPNNYDFFATGPSQLRPQLAPGGTVTDQDTELVELATLELTLVGTPPGNSQNRPPINVAPTITLTPTPTSAPGGVAVPATALPVKNGTTNTFVKDNISVATNSPATTPVTYELDVEVTGYDTTNFQNLAIDFLAGQVVTRQFELPKLGSVSGTIVGDTDPTVPAPNPPTDLENRPIDGTTTRVVVTPLGIGATNPNTPGTPFTPSITGNTYSFGGRDQEWFRIDVSSVGYTPQSRVVRVINDNDGTEDFTLAIVPGSIDLTVVRDLVGRVPVPGATYQAFPGTCPQTGSTPAPAGVGTDGTANITPLTPGAYCLTVREQSGSTELAFPAIATITVGRSTTPLPASTTATHVPVGATTTVTAPLPAIRTSVTGTVRAENRNGDPVALPASITLDIDYADTVLETTSDPTGTTPNTVTRTDQITVTPTAGVSSWTYSFSNVPVGVHSITPQRACSPPTVTTDCIDGYTPKSSPVTVTVGTSGGFGPTPANDIVYIVENLDVVVDLVHPNDPTNNLDDDVFLFPAGTPTLTSPVANTTPETYTAVYDSANQRLTFSNVAPELGNFRLAISDPLHSYAAAPILVAVPVLPTPAPPADRVQTVSVTATPAKGRVSGTLSQFELPNASGGMGTGTTIRLTPTGTTTGPAPDPIVTTGVTNSYSFDAPGGTYELTVERAGYTEPVVPVLLVDGRILTENLRIDKLAPISATINTSTTVPAGTSVWLVRNNNPSDDIPLVRDGATNVWLLDAVPGQYLYVEARAPLHRVAREPSTASPVLNLAIGTPFARNFTLSPRTLDVEVVEAGGTTAITDATVSVTVGATTVTDTTSPYLFVSTDPAPRIPVTGTGTATVSAPSKRTNTGTFGDQTAQTIQVPLSPLVTASGSINAPAATAADRVIWAESGTTKIYGSITVPTPANPSGENVYTIAGLTNDLTTGGTRSWTIKYDKLGTGTGTGTPFDVTATSANSVQSGSITVSPQNIPVTFTVNSNSPSGPLVGATVTIGSLTGVTRSAQAPTATDPGWAAGTVVINVPENSPRTWTASLSPAYVTSAQKTLSAFTSRAAVTNDPNAAVTLVSRTLTLTIRKGTGFAPPGTTVVISCPTASTTCTNPPATGTYDKDTGLFTFVPPAAAGTYTITATSGGSASTTVNVATDGALGVLAATTITIT